MDNILLFGGIIVIVVMVFGAGTVWRVATKRAKRNLSDIPATAPTKGKAA